MLSPRTVAEIEQWSHRLLFSIEHFNHGCWHTGWAGANREPFNRLFLVAGPTQAGSITWGRQRITLQAGKRYLMPAAADLRFEFVPGAQLLGFHFSCEIVAGVDCFAHLAEVVTATCPIGAINQLSLDAAAIDQPGAMLALHARCLGLIADLIPQTWTDLASQQRLQQRYADLVRQIQRDWSATRVTDLAHGQGLSADQLSKRFRRDIGLPLKTYINRLVIRRACDLLRSTDRSVASIAAELQFSSDTYASRFLQRHLGMTASQYRQLDARIRL